jgi:hypothetical protein
MESLILAFSFVSAIVIAACVVTFFSTSIDAALARVIPEEMTPAWSRYVKFALFVVTFAGGMRLSELEAFLTMRTPAGPPLAAGHGLLEVFKSITGSLIAASGTLLGFFAVTLAVYASMRFYQSHRADVERLEAKLSRATERPASGTDRLPVGTERHSVAKERQRTEDAGRFL